MRTTTPLTEPAAKDDSGDGAVGITELEKFEPTRVDGVKTPANGFPILMMKGIGGKAAPAVPAREKPAKKPAGVLGKAKRAEALAVVRGLLDGSVAAVVVVKDAPGYDESADIAGAQATIKQIADLIVSEATQLGAGRLEEAGDIATLLDAVYSMKCFLRAEQAQDGAPDPAAGCGCGPGCPCCMDATMLAQSAKAADDGDGDLSKAFYDELVKAKYSADQKRTMMARGAAIPNAKGEPSYPIDDAQDVKRAVRAVGRGNVPHGKIRAHIKRNAKRVGASNLIPDEWKGGKTASKGAILKASQAHNEGPAITPDVIKQAVAEVAKASEERIAALEAELTKVRNMPIPGGPHIVTSLNQRPAEPPQAAVRAAQLRAIAAKTSDPEVRRAYTELAAREEGAPTPKG